LRKSLEAKGAVFESRHSALQVQVLATKHGAADEKCVRQECVDHGNARDLRGWRVWTGRGRSTSARAKKRGDICSKIVTVLNQKVLFLKLDTQHFTSMQSKKGVIAGEMGKMCEIG
jgi:hypothetical protein